MTVEAFASLGELIALSLPKYVEDLGFTTNGLIGKRYYSNSKITLGFIYHCYLRLMGYLLEGRGHRSRYIVPWCCTHQM